MSFDILIFIHIDSDNYSLQCDNSFAVDRDEATNVVFSFYAFASPFPPENSFIFHFTNGDGDELEPSHIGGYVDYDYLLTKPSETFHLTVTNPEVDPDYTYNCEFTLTTNIPPPLSVTSFLFDSQPIACNGIYYKFCDLSARTSYVSCNNTACTVNIIGEIESNEADNFSYELEVGPNIYTGTVTLNDMVGFTRPYSIPLRSEYTDVRITFTNDDGDEPIIIECNATIQRLASNLFRNIC